MKMSAYKISENFQDVAGRKVMSPHHSHPTNGVGPSDSSREVLPMTMLPIANERKTAMKKIAKFVFETAYGPFIQKGLV